MTGDEDHGNRKAGSRAALWPRCGWFFMLASAGNCWALYGIGPKYSNTNIGIAIAAITITAILNWRFTLRLLPRLRSSTMGGACTGFRTIGAIREASR
jgi:hypothetical protein